MRTEPHAHVLQTLGVCLPRLEEEVKARFRKESVNIAFVVDSAAQIHLSPGAVALVPVRASRLFSGEVQAQDFPGSAVSLAAFGPVEGVESMLFLTNRSGLDIDLELGATVAIGQYETAALVVNSDQAEEFAESVNFSSGHREEVVENQYSTRQVTAPYPLGSKHVRIAQPWDLKRGLEFDVLREPGKTAVQLAARFSAVKLLAPDCKTSSRARDIAIPGVPNPPCRLRSDVHPEGLPGLPPHLQKRVAMGNEMFEGAVAIANDCSSSNTAFLLEHLIEATDGSSREQSGLRPRKELSSSDATVA